MASGGAGGPTPQEELERKDRERARIEASRINRNNQKMTTMIETQQKMLLNFYRASTEAGKESVRKDMENRQDLMQKQLKEMKRNFALYGKYMSKSEKKLYQEMYKSAQKGMDDIAKEMDARFGDMQDSVDELAESFSEKMDRIGDQLREVANSLNLDAIRQSLEESVDSYITNLRQIDTVTNDTFDKIAYGDLVDATNKEFGAMNRAQISEVAQKMVEDTGIRNVDDMVPYLKGMASADILNLDKSSLEALMWKDMDQGQQGRMFRNITNMAQTLTETDGLYTSTQSILSVISENIDAIYALTAKDAKKQTKMVASLAALQALEDASANAGVTNMTEMFKEWSDLTTIELWNDDRFQTFSALTGTSADQFKAAMGTAKNGETGDLADIIERYQNVLGSMNEAQLYAFKDNLGFDKVWQMQELANAEGVVDTFKEAQEAALSGIGTDENGEISLFADTNLDNLASAADESVGALQRFTNALTSNPLVSGVSDFFGGLGLSISDVAGLFTIGSNVVKGIGQVAKLFGADGALSGIGSAISSAFSTGLSGLGSVFSGALSSLGSIFSGGVSGLGSVLSGIGSHISGAMSSFSGWLSGLGGAGAGAPAWLTSLGSTLSSAGSSMMSGTALSSGGAALAGTAALGVTGAVLTLKDAYAGYQKSVDWLGEEEGNLMSGKVSSTLGGALGGTGPGILDEGTVTEKAKNVLGNTAKYAAIGGAIGSIIPGVGTAIGAGVGAIAGAVTGALGGEKIAKIAQGTWNFIKECGSSAFDAVGEGVEAFSSALSELGPLGQELGQVVSESWGAVTETKDKILEVWADPDKGLPGKIFGSIGALFSGAGKVATSIIKGVKNIAGKAWDGIKNIASKAWQGIQDIASGIWNGLQDGVKTFAEAGATLMEGAGSFAEGLGKGVGSAAEGIGTGFGNAVAGTGQAVGVTLEGLGTGAGNFFNGMVTGIGDAFGSAVSSMGEAFNSAVSGIGDAVGSVLGGAGSLAQGVGVGGGAILAGGSTLIDSLTGGRGVLGSITGAVDDLRHTFFGGKEEANIAGLNLTGDPILDRLDIMTEYLRVISENGGVGASEDKGLVGDAVSTVRDVATGVGAFVAGAASQAYEGAKQFTSNVAEGVRNVVNNISEGASNVWNTVTSWLPSFEGGISEVPNDGLAYIHKGEAVLTPEQAQVVRAEADGGIEAITTPYNPQTDIKPFEFSIGGLVSGLSSGIQNVFNRIFGNNEDNWIFGDREDNRVFGDRKDNRSYLYSASDSTLDSSFKGFYDSVSSVQEAFSNDTFNTISSLLGTSIQDIYSAYTSKDDSFTVLEEKLASILDKMDDFTLDTLGFDGVKSIREIALEAREDSSSSVLSFSEIKDLTRVIESVSSSSEQSISNGVSEYRNYSEDKEPTWLPKILDSIAPVKTKVAVTAADAVNTTNNDVSSSVSNASNFEMLSQLTHTENNEPTYNNPVFELRDVVSVIGDKIVDLGGELFDNLVSIVEPILDIQKVDNLSYDEDVDNNKAMIKGFKDSGLFGNASSSRSLFSRLSNSIANSTGGGFGGGRSSGGSGGGGGFFSSIFGGGSSSSSGSFGGGRTSGGSFGSSGGSGGGGGGTATFSSNASDFAAWISDMTSTHEGNYGSINYNDNGAVSIGKMQWHGDNARNLLTQIRDTDPNTFNSIVQQYGATNWANSLSSSWSTHVVQKGSTEASVIKALLESPTGQAVQEEQRRAFAQNYIDKAKSKGLSDPKAIAYIADMYNQYGMYSELINNKIIPQALQAGGTLDAVYQATQNNTTKYLKRRGEVYNQLVNADLSGISSFDVGTPWVEGDQVALIHDEEMIVPADVNPLNPANQTVTLGGDYSEPSGSGDNSDVVDAIKWMVSRLEAKLDKIIQNGSSATVSRPATHDFGDLNKTRSLANRLGR